MTRPTSRFAALAAAWLVAGVTPWAAAEERAPGTTVDNVLVITLDGFRWQELFGGYDATLNTKADGGVSQPEPLRARFDRPTPESRREALLPFVWGIVARDGQILGDATRHSRVRVTNGFWFSYPGYNEMLAGFADPRIDSNDKNVNPNQTVLEWLNHRPGFAGRVAAFASWDVLPFIVAAERSGVHANGGGPAVLEPASDRDRLLNAFAGDIACDRDVLRGAVDLVDLIDVNNAFLRFGNVEVGCLQEAQDDVFHIFSDITGFRQRCRIGYCKRHFQDARQCFSDQCLSRPCGAEEQYIGFADFDF